jgi:chemotaxis protein histidine kinase CheA
VDPRHDPEIVAVFLEEGREYVRIMTTSADPEEVGRAIHGIKGASGMIGFDALYRVIGEHERRHKGGDTTAAAALGEAILAFLAKLGPEPERDSFAPGDLEELGRYFDAEAAEHLATIDRAVAELDDRPGDEAALEDLRRAFHTLKGAADAVQRAPIAQAAHLVEEIVVRGGGIDAARMGKLERAIPLLHAIVAEDQATPLHLRALRVLAGRRESADAMPAVTAEAPPSSLVPAAPAAAPERRRIERRRDPEGIIRVEARAVDGLIDGIGELQQIGQRVARRSSAIRRTARDVTATRVAVVQALRAIGPPRPWGPPAAALTALDEVAAELSATAAALDAESDALALDEEVVRRVSDDARGELGRMRMAPARWLFERVAASLDAEARHAGRDITLRSEGLSVEIDRALAERLVDPMIQIARNAVIHGIEDPETRARQGKPLGGTVTLSARMHGGDVVLAIADDGRGIDVEAVRRRGVELGLLPPREAASAPPGRILEAIFLPGFTTRPEADEHAGRGVGLDVVRREVERFGGSVRVGSTHREGTRFEVTFHARVFVLWALLVRLGEHVIALPAHSVGDVVPLPATGRAAELPTASLPVLLGLDRETAPWRTGAVVSRPAGEVLLELGGELDPVELVARRMPPLLEGLAPYVGTAIGPDGRITLLVDPAPLADRVLGMGEAIPVAPPIGRAKREERRLRVLLVEDSATTRELLAAMLRHAGHEVDAVSDGRQALRRLRERRVDVVVTDVAMPHMDGLTLVTTLRAQPETATLPVVIVSSRAGPDTLAFAERHGATLLAKPVARQRLVETIRRIA